MSFKKLWESRKSSHNHLGNRWAKNGLGDDGFGGWMSDEWFWFNEPENQWIHVGAFVELKHVKDNKYYPARVIRVSVEGAKCEYFREDGKLYTGTYNPVMLSQISSEDTVEFRQKLAAHLGQEPPKPAPQPQVAAPSTYVPIKVPFKVKDQFKTIAAGNYKWDGENKTWLIKSSALTPDMKERLTGIGVSV